MLSAPWEDATLSIGSIIPIFHNHLLSLVSIPILGGILGYVINWTGVWMLYQPVEFRGVRVPGLKRLAPHLPRKLREIPGVMRGGIGWQGIIPSRAAKMGTIAVDNQIDKIGTPADLYDRFDPDEVSKHIIASSEGEIRNLIERIMEREYPEIWRELPPRTRENVHARVQKQLPEVVDEVTDRIRDEIDQLLDVRVMVSRRLETKRELTNKLFHEVGAQEFRFIIRFGFVFAFLCALPLIPLLHAYPKWWVLPVAWAIIGYATNWLGIWLIYEPVEPRRIGPFKFQGLFVRRQYEAAEAYAQVVAEEIITLRNVAYELTHGPAADRTRELIESSARPAIDRAVGAARPALAAAIGPERYEAARESFAAEAVGPTLAPLEDPEFSRKRSRAIRELFVKGMREMSPHDFVESLRAATRQDEWLLVAHGALFGAVGGLIHYVIFGS